MLKLQYVPVVLLTFICTNAYAIMDHSRHQGMGGESSGSACIHPHLDKIKPEKLSLVAPGSEFSFVVFNIDKPEQVSVTVKNQPVEINTEFKDPFYVVKGKIPNSLKSTAARIDVKVDSKYSSCRLQEGWLIKISE